MKKLLICFITLFSMNIYSQNVFQNGSYTNKQNTTVKGLIKIVSDTNIIFKENADSKERMFTAKTLNGFSLEDPFKKYISLSNEENAVSFYEYVIEGDISLLILNKVYFINDQANGLKKLEVKKIEKSTDQGVFESTINSYIGVLSYYAKDCESSQAEVNSVKYNRRSLSDFVRKLNQCNNSDIKDYSVQNIVNLLELGITVGGNFASFEDTRTNGYKTDGGSFGLSIGGFVSYSPNITKYNLSFLLGIEYNQKKVDYTYQEANFFGPRVVTHDASVIEPSLVVLYQPFYNNQGLLSPYIGLGTSYGFTLKHDIEVIDTFFETSEDRDVNQSFSFLFKAGTFIDINKHKFLIEFAFSDYNYQTPGSAEDYGNNFQIKAGYVFNLK